MKKKKKLITIISAALAGVLCLTVILVVALSGKSGKKDAIYLMIDETSGLFNPFYATAGTDHDVIGMTQIGMLSTDRNGATTAGDAESTVVKAFSYKYDEAKDETVYNFVIKNNLKFSDGVTLSMNDVMFNIYEYLDPVYTGSSTMYSTKIKGLKAYRTQIPGAGSDDAETELEGASGLAYTRRSELRKVYEKMGKVSDNVYSATPEQMKEYIASWKVSDGYKAALGDKITNYNAQLQADYEYAVKLFKEEIVNDYKAAKESFDVTSGVYKPHAEKLKSDVFKFFLYEGYIKPEYNLNDQNKEDKNSIKGFRNEQIATRYATEEAAIKYVQDDKIKNNFNDIVSYWGTASTMLTKFEGDARSKILQDKLVDGMAVPRIDGIKSLGHDTTETTIEIKEGDGYKVGGDLGTYKIARNHDDNNNGAPTSLDEYDVLRITVEGVDPKAIYNFGFTVAPQHYYAAPDGADAQKVDIKNNKFGLNFADSAFQENVIQSQQHVRIPVGAGPFKATDKANSDNPGLNDFNKDNTVYYKANDNFMFEVKAKKLRFMVVSSTNAIEKLKKGEIDYITPQAKKENYEELDKLKSKGIKSLHAPQLGYGYIGINAGKVPNIYIRRAIMAAMDTSLVTEYYRADSVETIQWPMSKESWAYPYADDGTEMATNIEYTMWKDKTEALKRVKTLMGQAGVSAGDSQLSITFTVAGSSISEHPTFSVFKQAQEILNEAGWNVEIKADSQALTKLATGSLAVWAAAWGSTIDPDMYQVYHKDSTATSTLAWGYREIKNNASLYPDETEIINELSDIIDDARAIDDQTQRKGMYQKAMTLVLRLAVEMPVYQRDNLYAYNGKAVKGFNENVNPYSSPLEKIWELELVK